MTRRTAISLPDVLYRQIERARRRSRKDRSTWIQEAAQEYLAKRAHDEEVEAWLSAEERRPLNSDDRSFVAYGARELGKRVDELARRRPRVEAHRAR